MIKASLVISSWMFYKTWMQEVLQALKPIWHQSVITTMSSVRWCTPCSIDVHWSNSVHIRLFKVTVCKTSSEHYSDYRQTAEGNTTLHLKRRQRVTAASSRTWGPEASLYSRNQAYRPYYNNSKHRRYLDLVSKHCYEPWLHWNNVLALIGEPETTVFLLFNVMTQSSRDSGDVTDAEGSWGVLREELVADLFETCPVLVGKTLEDITVAKQKLLLCRKMEHKRGACCPHSASSAWRREYLLSWCLKTTLSGTDGGVQQATVEL